MKLCYCEFGLHLLISKAW